MLPVNQSEKIVNLTRECMSCHAIKSSTEFHRLTRSQDGINRYCKECTKKHSNNWRKRRPEDAAASARRTSLRKYGLTEESFNILFSVQAGKCLICNSLLKSGRHGSHIDHDHLTGKVRGILCMHCNTGIGKFFDSPELLEMAAKYLRDRKI